MDDALRTGGGPEEEKVRKVPSGRSAGSSGRDADLEKPEDLNPHIYDLLIALHEKVGKLEGKVSILLWMVGGVLLSVLGKIIVSQMVSVARALVQP